MPTKRKRTAAAKPRESSDQIFRAFVESVEGYAIYTLDQQGRVTSWNQGAERLKGYSPSEIIGQDYSCFFTPEDQRAGKPRNALSAAARRGRLEGESWLVRKDKSRFWASTVLTAIKDSKGRLIGFAKITRDITDSKRNQEALLSANNELAAEVSRRKASERDLALSERSLRELSSDLLRAQDDERRRIGRELHDSVGQYLAMLKMQLESIDLSPKRSPGQMAAQVARCARLADDALREVRTVSHLLYPPTLEDLGLKSAVPWYLDGFSRRSGIRTTLEIDADFPRLNTDIEIALFRVLQESLNNVHRHSGSDRAFIRLSIQQNHVNLHIKDVGKGIPAELLQESCKDWLGSQGVGLRGMRERMRQLGGDLTINSNGYGTELHASAPLESPAADAII